MIRIGIDLMGSDADPALLLDAVSSFFQTVKKEISFTLFATEEILEEHSLPTEIRTCLGSESVSMEEDPLIAFRRKKNSTMALGIQQLKEGKIDAFISAGNTGALLAFAHATLSRLPGIDRPALVTLLPTKKEEVAVLDVGANISCKAEHLVQFALMGIAYQKSRGILKPRVGLLNIGAEAKKGTAVLKETYQQLLGLNKKIAFCGNIEGRDAFNGEIDVLVTDGFTGNVFLKTAEGVGSFLLHLLEESIPQENRSLLSTLRHRLNYAEYPGALLCGVEGIVMKCHGASHPQSLIRSIKAAARLVEHKFLAKLGVELARK